MHSSKAKCRRDELQKSRSLNRNRIFTKSIESQEADRSTHTKHARAVTAVQCPSVRCHLEVSCSWPECQSATAMLLVYRLARYRGSCDGNRLYSTHCNSSRRSAEMAGEAS